MKKTRFPLTAIAIVLASTTTLVAIADVAAARNAGGGHQDVSHQTNAQGNRQAAIGTLSRDMTRKPPVYREKGSKSGNADLLKKHKGCGKLIVPTAGCPTPARDPVGNTRPSLPTEAKQPAGMNRQPVLEYVKKVGPQSANQPANAPAQPAAAPASVVAVSNGVTRTTLEPGKGLTVSSSGNGAINVSNGTNTVTLAGGSVTLHGAPAVTPGAGVQVVRLPNGDYSVAVKPSPAAPTDKVPPGVTIADDAKFVGHQLGNVVAAPVLGVVGIAGLPVAGAVGAIQGHPVKTIEKYIDVFGNEVSGIFE
jgi:hypothetical protein